LKERFDFRFLTGLGLRETNVPSRPDSSIGAIAVALAGKRF
jgi:hypothetical protein